MANRRQVTYSSHPNHRARAAHARGDKMFRTYDTSAIQPKKSRTPLIFATALILFVIIVLLVGGSFLFKGCSSDDNLLASGQTVEVTVADGSGAQAIAASLKEAGLISDTSAFTKRVSELEADTQLKPGTYTFTGGESLDDIISQLKTGPEETGTKLTIPEGYTLASIASAVETATNGTVTADAFTQAASNASVYADSYSFLQEVGTNSLEGFLFPKTYTIKDGATADDIIRMMLSQFQTEIASLNFDYPTNAGLSMYDAVKLASIVEKESTDSTRGTVASVFYNRLSLGMALQSDATTAYEVGHDPTSDEVHADTPYSTYTHTGLPPTPICCPGLAALQAVCSPETTSYLYFYFQEENGEMKYYFSETYEEHQSAIAG